MTALESPVQAISGSVTIPGNVNIEFPGPVFSFEKIDEPSTPGGLQTLIAATVPLGQNWKLRRIEVVSRAYADFAVLVNGTKLVKTGKTSATESTISLRIDPWEPVAAGDILTVEYNQDSGPVVPVSTRLEYTIDS